MRYPVTLTKDDNDTYLVTFPDVPDAVTFGDTKEEALGRAADALLTVVDAYMKDRRDIPSPSPRAGTAVELPALESTKIELYRAMRDANIGKYELAKRLNWHLPQVDRVLNVRHGSQIEQMEAAFSAVGKRLELVVRDVQNAGRSRVFATAAARRDEQGVPGASIMEQRRRARAHRTGSRVMKRAAKKR